MHMNEHNREQFQPLVEMLEAQGLLQNKSLWPVMRQRAVQRRPVSRRAKVAA